VNIYNDGVPSAVYLAILAANNEKPPEYRIRATELIDSPQIRQLKIKHWNDIKLPASRFIFSLRGQLFHALLSKYHPKGSHAEMLLETHLPLSKYPLSRFITLTGHPDLFTPSTGTLEDYKETSLWAFNKPKDEWTEQLNVYAWMLNKYDPDYPVQKIVINGMLREWSESTAARKKDYPQSAFQAIEIPLWTSDRQQEYVGRRLWLHSQECNICTDKERWRHESKWAVVKKGNKRAERLLDSLFAAEVYCQNKKLDIKKHEIVERPGGYPRCKLYCHVAEFCQQWQKEKLKGETNEIGEESSSDNLGG
jgi:hypothetical protein